MTASERASGAFPTTDRRGSRWGLRQGGRVEQANRRSGGHGATVRSMGARAFPAEELRDDFRLACVSRAVDDRQIALQKQSRVFFQISGAGHEALLLALARELRAGY